MYQGTCVDFGGFNFDTAKAAAGLETLTIALAATIITAFVLLVTLTNSRARLNNKRLPTKTSIQALILLPAAFGLELLSSLMFAVASGEHDCIRATGEVFWATVPSALALPLLFVALGWILTLHPYPMDGLLASVRFALFTLILAAGGFLSVLMHAAQFVLDVRDPTKVYPGLRFDIRSDPNTLIMIGPAAAMAVYQLITWLATSRNRRNKGATARILLPVYYLWLSLLVGTLGLASAAIFSLGFARQLHNVRPLPTFTFPVVRVVAGLYFALLVLLFPRTWEETDLDRNPDLLSDVEHLV